MKESELRQLIREAKEEVEKECPAATQDVSLNTANRDRAIQADFIKYGPLNVEEPGDFWEKIAKKWDTDVEAAKKSKCANCVAFDIFTCGSKNPRCVAFWVLEYFDSDDYVMNDYAR